MKISLRRRHALTVADGAICWRASKSHYWFKSYGNFAEWVDFAHWCSFIGGGSSPAACAAGLFTDLSKLPYLLSCKIPQPLLFAELSNLQTSPICWAARSPNLSHLRSRQVPQPLLFAELSKLPTSLIYWAVKSPNLSYLLSCQISRPLIFATGKRLNYLLE